MKKYFIHGLITTFIIGLAFAFNISLPIASAGIQSMTISQFVELLITVGAVPTDKITAARAMAVTLGRSGISTSTLSSSPSVYIQVLSPNGGESWDMNSDVPYTITWGISSAIPVNIGLVPTRGPVCNLTAIPVSSRNGNNSYNVLLKIANCFNSLTGTSTPLIDGSYKIQVSSVTGATVKDESDVVFKILPKPVPSIKITYPNGGEKLVTNTYYDIKYTLKNTTERGLKISFIDLQGNSVYSVNVFGSKGVYRLRVPSSVNAGAFKLKIEMTAADNTKIEDISDNFFWISPAI